MIVFQVFLFHIRKHSPHLSGSEKGVYTTLRAYFYFFPLLTRQRELRFYDTAAVFLKEPFTTLFHTFLRFDPLFLKIFPSIYEALRPSFLQPSVKTFFHLLKEQNSCLYYSRQWAKHFYDIENWFFQKSYRLRRAFQKENGLWLQTIWEQDSPCTTLIRFCLFVPRAKLAKSKFRLVCQKWICVLRHLLGISLPNPSNHSASFAAVPACGSHSFDFLIKRKMLISPNNIQTGQPKLTRIVNC